MALYLLFLFLTISSKKKKGKIKLRYLIPTIIFMLPIVALACVNIIYNTTVRPKPTVSELVLENSSIKLGNASKVQPTTLDEFIDITANQIKLFHKEANDIWPRSSFENSVAYFITNDKKEAWKVNYDGTYYKLDDPKQMPKYGAILGYPVEFAMLDTQIDGEKGMVIVISKDELLDQQAYDKYTHLGMYDPIITYIHEGFHLYAQTKDDWINDSQNVSREAFTNNVEGRKLRGYIMELLYEAIQDEYNRDLYTKQAIKLNQRYKADFPDEFASIKYLDKVEGTAFYYEVISCLRTAYPDEINKDNYLDAAKLWTTNRPVENTTLANKEAYEIGALSGILLDMSNNDKTKWKEELMKDPNLTPLDTLANLYTKEEIQNTPEPEISQEFSNKINESIKNGIAVKNNVIAFVYNIFF